MKLRGHTVLCLQGFRGEGYSQGFVENLAAIHRQLSASPEQEVEVIDVPDAVCAACPHRALSGCTVNHEHSEVEMQAQDRHVLALLGLQSGSIVPWREILDRIRTNLTGDSLPGICGQCRWLPLGYCREGIDRLRSHGESTPSTLIFPRTVRSPQSSS
ncbi:MAG: DUF1284 domain-containing protein [Nitrospiraceae bacterium]